MIRFGDITIDRSNNTITHGDITRRWVCASGHPGQYNSRATFQLLEMLLLTEYGLGAKEIFDRLYADDANGGPETGYKHITVLLHYLDTEIRALKLAMHKAKIAGEMRYWARPKCD